MTTICCVDERLSPPECDETCLIKQIRPTMSERTLQAVHTEIEMLLFDDVRNERERIFVRLAMMLLFLSSEFLFFCFFVQELNKTL